MLTMRDSRRGIERHVSNSEKIIDETKEHGYEMRSSPWSKAIRSFSILLTSTSEAYHNEFFALS